MLVAYSENLSNDFLYVIFVHMEEHVSVSTMFYYSIALIVRFLNLSL
jgi:hypothetical protein